MMMKKMIVFRGVTKMQRPLMAKSCIGQGMLRKIAMKNPPLMRMPMQNWLRIGGRSGSVFAHTLRASLE